MDKKELKTRMILMIIIVGVIFAGIFGWKVFGKIMMKRYIASQVPIVTVSAMSAAYSDWQPQYKAVGSTRAIRGVYVTTQLAGMVETIHFKPGAMVKEGDLLVSLNIKPDVAQLKSLQANAALAKITYNRDKAQYAAEAVSKQVVDNDLASLKSLEAQVTQQFATIAKKVIHAPFTGRLGICLVNPGQYLNPGDKITALQQLDPLYVDFYLPQQALMEIKVEQPVTVTVDTFPGKIFTGRITTIDPIVDQSTRNVQVEATVDNPKFLILPGMFATTTIETGIRKHYITLPQTAVSFNPYGDIVYVLSKSQDKSKDNKEIWIATQRFITTGETRGEQIAILQGVKDGEMIVTSGQLKLKNGSKVTINNSIVPSDSAEIKTDNNHNNHIG